MTSLSDHTDRLCQVAKSIKSTTARTGVLGNANHPGAGVAGPFTAAVLYTHLGDLIRDIDPSELGLFNLVHPADPGANHARDRNNGRATIPEVTRVEFPGATPLKKPLARKEDTHKRKELEPELYAQAALKYMDRYESIRPMPRAHAQVESIIEQLAAVRENMQTLSNSLEQTRIADVPQSPKDLANQEERRIHYIQTKLLDLNNRKEAALKRGRGGLKKIPRSKLASSRQNLNSKPPPPTTSSRTDIREETFWATPAPAARTLRFDNLLNDEFVDLGDVSTSFASPMPTPRNTQSLLAHPIYNIAERADNQQPPPEAPLIEPDETFRDHLKSEDRIVADEDDQAQEETEGEDEKTVVLKKLPPSSPPPQPPSPSPLLSTAIAEVESPSPGRQSNSARTPSGTGQSQKPRVRVTNEVERIVTKIWTTLGEIIMPGHPFDVSGSGPAGTKPPRAKETIALLHTISTQTPIPTSPTSSSLSSHSTTPQSPGHATPQQILTAYLIVSLLSSQPPFSMPLHKVKEALAEKAQGSLGVGRGTTSVLYGCVAKRLVRIDRGGGEQVVKFDVI